MPKKLTDEEFKARLLGRKGGAYTALGPYASTHAKVLVRHEGCGYEWMARPNVLLVSGHGCPRCGDAVLKTKEQYGLDVARRWGEGSYEVVGEYVSCMQRIETRHSGCGHTWGVAPNTLLAPKKKVQPCPSCNKKVRYYTEAFSALVERLAPGEFRLDGPYANTKTPVAATHLACGRQFPLRPWSFITHATRCLLCANEQPGSKASRQILAWLKKSGLLFETEKAFPGCRHKRLLKFDFWIPDRNLLVEYDGRQHFKVSKLWAAAHAEGRIRDAVKNEFCLSEGIGLLRIPYTSDHLAVLREVLESRADPWRVSARETTKCLRSLQE